MIPALLLAAASPHGGAVTDEAWRGLAGAQLKEAVRESCRPAAYLTEILGPDGFWEVMRNADGTEGAYLNRFSDVPLPFAPVPESPPASAYAFRLAPAVWWEPDHPHGQALELDLYNVFPADGAVAAFVGAMVPAAVTSVEGEYGFITWGTGYLGGGHRCWQPPSAYEGDVARAIMYIVTLYPERIAGFGQHTYGYFDGTAYPSLAPAAARQLMAWHSSDPVSGLERRRNEVFALAQGNVNPFVAFPALADYLWGDKAGEPYLTADESPAPAAEPLRARYSISDSRISLSSPWIAGGAEWTVDGIPVSEAFLVPSELGTGMHTLSFRSPSESGILVIEVTAQERP